MSIRQRTDFFIFAGLLAIGGLTVFFVNIANQNAELAIVDKNLAQMVARANLQSATNKNFYQPTIYLVEPGIFSTSTLAATSTPIANSTAISKRRLGETLRVPILMYHYIESPLKDPAHAGLYTDPKIFAKQLETLTKAGYTPLMLKDLGLLLDGEGDLPTKPIILTFDDGYRDFYDEAYPILEQYNVVATVFVIVNGLDLRSYITTAQAQELAASGLVEVADHTFNHLDLKNLPLAKSAKEIVDSKVALEKIINQPVETFAYPYGFYNNQDKSLVKAAGYSVAVSTKPGIMQSAKNRYELYRLRPGNRTGKALLTWLEQLTKTEKITITKP